jgi:hypothetical protein
MGIAGSKSKPPSRGVPPSFNSDKIVTAYKRQLAWVEKCPEIKSRVGARMKLVCHDGSRVTFPHNRSQSCGIQNLRVVHCDPGISVVHLLLAGWVLTSHVPGLTDPLIMMKDPLPFFEFHSYELQAEGEGRVEIEYEEMALTYADIDMAKIASEAPVPIMMSSCPSARFLAPIHQTLAYHHKRDSEALRHVSVNRGRAQTVILPCVYGVVRLRVVFCCTKPVTNARVQPFPDKMAEIPLQPEGDRVGVAVFDPPTAFYYGRLHFEDDAAKIEWVIFESINVLVNMDGISWPVLQHEDVTCKRRR